MAEPRCTECPRLIAALAVRTSSPGFHSRPEQFRHSGASSAFDSGYEDGWRGRAFRNPYTRTDCIQAFTAGYQQGSQESYDEIAKLLAVPHA